MHDFKLLFCSCSHRHNDLLLVLIFLLSKMIKQQSCPGTFTVVSPQNFFTKTLWDLCYPFGVPVHERSLGSLQTNNKIDLQLLLQSTPVKVWSWHECLYCFLCY